jgi:hypothetical protein
MHGQTARPDCRNRKGQLKAIKSQTKHIFATFEARSFQVAVLLATNDCGKEWGSQLASAYGRYLSDLALDDCNADRNHRCLLNVSAVGRLEPRVPASYVVARCVSQVYSRLSRPLAATLCLPTTTTTTTPTPARAGPVGQARLVVRAPRQRRLASRGQH